MKLIKRENTGTGYIPEDLYLALGDLSSDIGAESLTENEMSEFRTLGNSGRKVEFLSARVLIRKLAANIGINPEKLEIVKDEMGKPYGIYGDNTIYISLAHTAEKILCGISTVLPLGVDIEPVDRTVDARLRKRIMNEKESLNEVDLVRIWTIKESFVKLEGKGLRTNLNDIVISRAENQLFIGRFNNEKSVNICSFQSDGYWIAVSYFN